jgi:hypothetical protein
LEVPADHDVLGQRTDDPDQTVSWRRVTDPKEVEARLLKWNQAHFRLQPGRRKNGNAVPTMVEEQREICPQICIPDKVNGAIKIAQKEVMVSHTTLGCNKTIAGNKEDQKQRL